MLAFVPHGPLQNQVGLPIASSHEAKVWNPLFGRTQSRKSMSHPPVPPLQAYRNPMNWRVQTSSTGLMTLAAAVPAVKGGASFFQLFIAFVAGGLFFSTAVAAFGAVFAIGRENVSRVLEVARIVTGHVLEVFWLALVSARDSLIGGPTRGLRWRVAWKVLREKLAEARQAAQEGVEAIRLEASLYAAAVGQPGLISIQYLVDHFRPYLLANIVEESFREALADVKVKQIRKVKLSEFDFGTKSPTLMAARAFDLGDEGVAFDVDTKWDSDMSATVKTTLKRLGFSVPCTVKNVRFDGVIRVILSPMTAEPPGFGATLISLPTAPTIRLDVKLAGGDITRMPWLRSEIMSAIQKSIADEFLWPKRVVIPSPVPQKNPRMMLSKQDLEDLEHTDPLLKAEKALTNMSVYQKTTLKKQIPESKDVNLDVSVGDEDDPGDDEEVEKAMLSGHPRLQLSPKQVEKKPRNIWDRIVKRFRPDLLARKGTKEAKTEE